MRGTRSKLTIQLAALKRLYMWHFRSRKLNLVLVTEFPKCGGTWFCNMLSDALGIPYPRHVFPKMQQNIMHGHHLFHPRMNKSICVMRDGRDVMVSAYFHFLFDGEGKSSKAVDYHRKQLQFDDYNRVVENLPTFIKYMFTDFAQKNFTHFSWSEMVQNTIKFKNYICVVKYESLLKDAAGQLQKAIAFYDFPDPGIKKLRRIVEKHSFENVTKRKQGEENRNSFIRRGISGDWKNYFNEEACTVFKEHGGEALIAAGYEVNLNWSNTLTKENLNRED